jgi:hypothetical protein
MQPPSEADVVAAVRSLEIRRDLKLAQADTLHVIQECLADPDFYGAFVPLAKATFAYLGHLIVEYRMDAEALNNQAIYTRHALDAARSNLVLPRANPRRPIG